MEMVDKANFKQLKTCSIKVTTTHTDKHQSPIVFLSIILAQYYYFNLNVFDAIHLPLLLEKSMPLSI